MINLKRVTLYSILSCITVAASVAIFVNLPEKQPQVAEKQEPEHCTEFAMLIDSNSSDKRIDCPLGFIETQETEHGNIVVTCRCQDPLRCMED